MRKQRIDKRGGGAGIEGSGGGISGREGAGEVVVVGGSQGFSQKHTFEIFRFAQINS